MNSRRFRAIFSDGFCGKLFSPPQDSPPKTGRLDIVFGKLNLSSQTLGLDDLAARSGQRRLPIAEVGRMLEDGRDNRPA